MNVVLSSRTTLFHALEKEYNYVFDLTIQYLVNNCGHSKTYYKMYCPSLIRNDKCINRYQQPHRNYVVTFL